MSKHQKQFKGSRKTLTSVEPMRQQQSGYEDSSLNRSTPKKKSLTPKKKKSKIAPLQVGDTTINNTTNSIRPSVADPGMKTSFVDSSVSDPNKRPTRYEQALQMSKSKKSFSRKVSDIEESKKDEDKPKNQDSPLEKIRKKRDQANEQKMAQLRKTISGHMVKRYQVSATAAKRRSVSNPRDSSADPMNENE